MDAGGGERQGGRAADAARGAGDEGDAMVSGEGGLVGRRTHGLELMGFIPEGMAPERAAKAPPCDDRLAGFLDCYPRSATRRSVIHGAL